MEEVKPVDISDMLVPNPERRPSSIHRKDKQGNRGWGYVVVWSEPVTMANSRTQSTLFFSDARYRQQAVAEGRPPEAVAREAAWNYWMERYRAEYRPTRCGYGQVHIEGRDGRAFHGALNDQSHRFVVEPRRGELGPFAWHATTGPWNPLSQTYERAADFCSNCRLV